MSMNFPNSPNDGDIFYNGAVRYIWNATRVQWMNVPDPNLIGWQPMPLLTNADAVGNTLVLPDIPLGSIAVRFAMGVRFSVSPASFTVVASHDNGVSAAPFNYRRILEGASRGEGAHISSNDDTASIRIMEALSGNSNLAVITGHATGIIGTGPRFGIGGLSSGRQNGSVEEFGTYTWSGTGIDIPTLPTNALIFAVGTGDIGSGTWLQAEYLMGA